MTPFSDWCMEVSKLPLQENRDRRGVLFMCVHIRKAAGGGKKLYLVHCYLLLYSVVVPSFVLLHVTQTFRSRKGLVW